MLGVKGITQPCGGGHVLRAHGELRYVGEPLSSGRYMISPTRMSWCTTVFTGASCLAANATTCWFLTRCPSPPACRDPVEGPNHDPFELKGELGLYNYNIATSTADLRCCGRFIQRVDAPLYIVNLWTLGISSLPSINE